MAFLYGDASESPLRSDMIALLPDAIDFAVVLLQADERLRADEARAQALAEATATQVEKMEALRETVVQAVSGADGDDAVARCAAAISRAATEHARVEIERVRDVLAAERAKMEAQGLEIRVACLRALEALLVKHDLPDTDGALRLQLSGAAYQARLLLRAPWGLEVELELTVPPSHALAHVLRVDKILDRLEVQAPEEGGWLRKEVKLRPQRLDKDFVSEVTLEADDTTIRLRTAMDGNGAGFDISIRGVPPHVRMVRVGETALPPFELADVDAERVGSLKEKLATLCGELRAHRSALVAARLDGAELRSIVAPRLLVERLMVALAPIVQEINRRSRAPGELVLKRLLGDGRREEVFIAKEELRRRLAPLSEDDRKLFAALHLDDVDAGPADAHRTPTLELDPADEVGEQAKATSTTAASAR
jgi:hypothetical protein